MKRKVVCCNICANEIEPGEGSISFTAKQSVTVGYEVTTVRTRIDICPDCIKKIRYLVTSVQEEKQKQVLMENTYDTNKK